MHSSEHVVISERMVHLERIVYLKRMVHTERLAHSVGQGVIRARGVHEDCLVHTEL